MKLLIVEEALKSPKGHWPEYIGTLAHGFRRLGDQVDVLTHAEAENSVVNRVDGIRWMTRSCWDDPKSQGKLGGLLHNRYFANEVKRYMAKESDYDALLFLTVRRQHLLGLGSLCRYLEKRGLRSKMLCLFVQGFGQFHSEDGTVWFPKNLNNRLAWFAFKRMQPFLTAGRLQFAAEAWGMDREIETFSGCPVSLYPHPVHFLSDPTTDQSPGELLLTCPGFARYEKGADLLQETIRRILRDHPECSVRFFLQWVDPFTLPDGSVCRPDSELLQHPRVELLDHPVSPDEYCRILQRTAAVLLPYRRESYYARVSRVAIEAAFLGLPVLYSKGTWNEKIVTEGYAAGAPLESLEPPAMVESILDFARRYPELAVQAREKINKARHYFSVENFRNLLVEFLDT